jgi:hypothetical protein
LPLQERDDFADKCHQKLATEPVGEGPELSEGIEEGFVFFPLENRPLFRLKIAHLSDPF